MSNYHNFVGTIASVSALCIRDMLTDAISSLNISVLTVVSYVDGKPLKKPLWVNTLLLPSQAAELGLEIKAKSLCTAKQFITPEELAKYNLTVSEVGTAGLTFSFDAIGINQAKARELNTPGLPTQIVYPASGAHNFRMDSTNSIITEFETVDDISQTQGYRPPSAVANFVQSQVKQAKPVQLAQEPLVGAIGASLEDFEF